MYPIACWLKIRNRISREFVLKHLNYTLGLLSDPAKWKIYIYNEDFNLPREYYEAYTVINKIDIIQNKNVRDLHGKIEKSKIAPGWKSAARALCSPYYYIDNSEYILNWDSDDFISFGPMENYLDKTIKIINEHNLSTLSYDYIFSHNIYDVGRKMAFIPNHWSFNINISHTQKMRDNIIETAILQSERLLKYIPNCNPNTELNIDILISTILKHDRPGDKYNAYITREGAWHNGFPNGMTYYSKLTDDNNFYWSFNGREGKAKLHNKTIILP